MACSSGTLELNTNITGFIESHNIIFISSSSCAMIASNSASCDGFASIFTYYSKLALRKIDTNTSGLSAS